MAIYLCKKCKDCKVYKYERDIKGTPFKFLYCKENKHIADEYDWFAETHVQGRTSYVRCTDPKRFGHNRFHTVFAKDGLIPDHINRNGLDNRFSNLRLLTERENSFNRSDNTKYPGTFKEGKYWVARIKIKGKYRRIGKDPDRKKAYAMVVKAKELYTGVK